jgi:hypothetical protein
MSDQNLGEPTKDLIEALSKKPVNVLTVRSLCKNHPGLIASAGLRLQAWATLLLGSDYQQFNFKKDITQENLPDCAEQHVLVADVHRTRAENEYFRLESTRELVQKLLQKFCVDHSIQYKQGMNEVLAPFLAINSNEQKETYLIYLLFKAFLFRYLERFFCIDDSSFLYKSFRLFHLLLVYHDPQLALHLTDFDFTPEFYAPQWFLTLYARALPINQVLRLWDMMIAVDDPAFIFFIGLNLLLKQRNNFLLSDVSNIPEIISQNISFRNEEEIDINVKEALQLYQITPRCLLRQLRLCCVSTVELTPLPSLIRGSSFNNNNSNNNNGDNSPSALSPTFKSMKINVQDYDQTLSLQSVRNCIAITAQELIESMLPPSHLLQQQQQSESNNNSSKKINNSNSLEIETVSSPSNNNSNNSVSSHIAQQYVIIDIRSYEESVLSGGGILPRAIQLEPEFLNRPEAFEVWLQHFDGTRGCNICIIDLPPPQWTGVNLLRRLLLGEGDGPKYANLMDRYEFTDLNANRKRLDALIAHSKNQQDKKDSDNRKDHKHGGKGGVASKNSGINNSDLKDNQSKYYKEEESILVSDLNSPAMLLAMVLQRNSFPHVCILDGGFPALIETLFSSKGKVEPIVVDHDSQKWSEFLRNTGRYRDKSAQSQQSEGGFARLKKMISKGDDHHHDENHYLNQNSEDMPLYMKKEKDLTDLERYQLALKSAERLDHSEMKGILMEKIAGLKNGTL